MFKLLLRLVSGTYSVNYCYIVWSEFEFGLLLFVISGLISITILGVLISCGFNGIVVFVNKFDVVKAFLTRVATLLYILFALLVIVSF